MDSSPDRVMKLDVFLRLGRVSNLPTVITNVMAGMVLAGGTPDGRHVALVGCAAAALYVGGMHLNDAFDADYDAAERPDRPIPAGEISRRAVFGAGFGLLVLGVVSVGIATSFGPATIAAASTAGLVVLYNAWHKGNPAAPVVMGLCRVGVYAMAGLSVTAALEPTFWIGAALLLGYVIGLTYVAKYEGGGAQIRRYWPLAGLFAPLAYALPSLPGAGTILWMACGAFTMWVYRALRQLRANIKKAVGSLIAGIALLDAILLARGGASTLCLAAFAMFVATLALHRRVAGT